MRSGCVHTDTMVDKHTYDCPVLEFVIVPQIERSDTLPVSES